MKTLVYVVCITNKNTHDFLYVCENKKTACKLKEISQTQYPNAKLVVYEEILIF